ncbi:MAG TPA: hypothetical protein VK666_26975 [Chryseolinea sp.]|nr:hypothetical protein [Chryseolinea sp.]
MTATHHLSDRMITRLVQLTRVRKITNETAYITPFINRDMLYWTGARYRWTQKGRSILKQLKNTNHDKFN